VGVLRRASYEGMISMRITTLILAILMTVGLAACGDTWRGAKKDTQDNIDATKRAL
jgi:predicted small secreted protein